MFLRYLLYVFLIYILYRLIFDFIIPIYKTTSQVKKQFREMHNQMQDQMNQQSNFTESSPDRQAGNSKTTSDKESAGDYIDFEEVK